MAARESSRAGTRQERRKAVTRAKIQEAAERLFAERGYAETSIEDISEAADVAVRTIYTHFPSKAAIMLDYFDSWVGVFVEEILQRPVDEPIVETVREALRAMGEAGWVDRVENDDIRVHPLVEHLSSGTPDIAGHIMQRWMREMQRLAADAAQRGDHPKGSLEPQARAVAVFTAWIAAMSAAGAKEPGRSATLRAAGGSPGLGILEIITRGDL